MCSMLPPLGERTVAHVLDGNLARHPDKTALRDPEVSLTYAELHAAARRLGGGLAGLGAGRGSPVLLMLDNHVDAVVAWLGVSLVGGLEVPVNTAYKGAILAHVLGNSGAETLVVEDRYCTRLAAVADELAALRTVVVRGGDGRDLPTGRFRVVPFDDVAGAAPADPVALQPYDVFGILYTSGTTGPSKGVVMPHGHAYNFATPAYMGVAAEHDVSLVTLPLFHIGGQLWGVYNAFIAGATAVVLPGFHASTFWDDARRYDATFSTLVGAMAGFLLQQPPRDDDRGHGMRRMGITPATADVDAFAERFDVELASGFGMTEASFVLVAPFGTVQPRRCGRPRPDYEVCVADEHDMPVAGGEVGQLLVRPREPWTMMLGYHGLPDKTQEAWRNLWFHTGDAFYEADDGELVFVDRIKDAIRRRGENVSSSEVEAAVLAHDAVAECAVVAVPSEHSEDEIKAVVVLVPGRRLPEAELIGFLVDRLPYFMVPRYVEIVGELPKTPTQRVQKQALRERGLTPNTWDREAAGIRVTRDS